MTADLVVDSVLYKPTSLTSLKTVVDSISTQMREIDRSIVTLYYFQVLENRDLYASWLDQQFESDPRFEPLLEALKAHRSVYESSISTRPCSQSGVFDYYMHSCMHEFPEQSAALEILWRQGIQPLLKSESYDEFKEVLRRESDMINQPGWLYYYARRSGAWGGLSGPELLAYSLYREFSFAPTFPYR